MDLLETRDAIYDQDNTFSNSIVRTVIDKSTPIYQFYKDINIFLTGASGFMGKVFIEKILRCYPDVGGIYILLRSKKNKTVEERLSDQFEDELFDRLKREQSDILTRKVHILSGDLNQPMLGLSSEDQQFIHSHIHVIVHAAASLRFDELIKDAYTLNVQATRDLLQLATRCKVLKAFVHVSTLYTHSYRSDIEEKFYSTQISYRDLEQLMAMETEENVEILTPMLFGKLYNNSYAFTKALGESVVEEYVHTVPLSMVRPAIVVSTWKEPLVGWVNNLYGPGGACAGAALGVIHTFYAVHDKKCDLIPVDVATNMIVSVVWKTACDNRTAGDNVPSPKGNSIKDTKLKASSTSTPPISPPVYNLSTSNRKPITWLQFMELNRELGFKEQNNIACTLSIWAYSFCLEQSRIGYLLRTWILHMLPGMIIDTLLQCLNKEPKLMKIYVKIEKFSRYFIPYVERDWVFGTRNIEALLSQLPEQDRSTLNYSMDSFEWLDYLLFYFRGGKLYVLKNKYVEDPTMPRKHIQRLWNIHYAFLTIVYTVFGLILYKLFTLYFNHAYANTSPTLSCNSVKSF